VLTVLQEELQTIQRWAADLYKICPFQGIMKLDIIV
jgi:hypothetical protein